MVVIVSQQSTFRRHYQHFSFVAVFDASFRRKTLCSWSSGVKDHRWHSVTTPTLPAWPPVLQREYIISVSLQAIQEPILYWLLKEGYWDNQHTTLSTNGTFLDCAAKRTTLCGKTMVCGRSLIQPITSGNSKQL